MNFAYDSRQILKGINLEHPPRPGGGDHGPVRLRQDHAAAPDRRRAAPDPGRGARRRPGGGQAQPRRTVRAAPQDGDAVPVRGAVHRHVVLRQRRLPDARAHRSAGGADRRSGADEAAGGRPARRAPAHALGALRRDGAARGAGAHHRARPDADHVRRAFRRPGPGFHGRHRPADPAPERLARRHLHHRHARRGRGAGARGLRLFHVRRRDRHPGHAGRTARLGQAVRASVRPRRDRRTDAVSLSGRRLRARPAGRGKRDERGDRFSRKPGRARDRRGPPARVRQPLSAADAAATPACASAASRW